MGQVNPTMPSPGQPRGSEEADLQNALQALLDEYNGNTDETNLTLALRVALGLNEGATKRRGSVNNAAEQSTGSTSYTVLGSPDRVDNISVPTGGALFILARGLWKESVHNAARAAIFVNGIQLKLAGDGGTWINQEITVGTAGATNVYKPFSTWGAGLQGAGGADADNLASPTTTDPRVFALARTSPSEFYGGICPVEIDPGAYTVELRYKTTSGTLSVKDRRLLVWTMGF